MILGVIFAGFAWCAYELIQPHPGLLAKAGSLGSVLAGSKPVLVEFYADWYGPCKQEGPEVEKLAGEVAGRAVVLRLEVDEHREVAAQYGVDGIPCFIDLKRGAEVSRHVGAIPPGMMSSMIGLSRAGYPRASASRAATSSQLVFQEHMKREPPPMN